MNVEQAIRKAVKTGDVKLGEKETLRAIHATKAKLIIVSENCPESSKSDMELLSTRFNIPVYNYEATSLALGSVCGKPFLVSMLSIIDAGESSVLELIREIA